ncbi:RING finger type zinc finger protein [uncultured virus]|nr:RING finger type zinc finger protein [uncultured virus]
MDHDDDDCDVEGLATLPFELLACVCAMLSLSELRSALSVSRAWNTLLDAEALWRLRCEDSFAVRFLTLPNAVLTTVPNAAANGRELVAGARCLFREMRAFGKPLRETRWGSGPTPTACAHYRHACKMRAACCGMWVSCPKCHDLRARHRMDPHTTRQMLCIFCSTVQPAAHACASVSCVGRLMSRYFCASCKLWADDRVDALPCHAPRKRRWSEFYDMDVQPPFSFACAACEAFCNEKRAGRDAATTHAPM